MPKGKTANLTESELAMLDVLILRAIEQGKPITGLLANESFVDDIVTSVENAASSVTDFVNKVIDGFNRSQQAEDDLFDRAIGHDPELKTVDAEAREALLKRLIGGGRVDLGKDLTVEELKLARRELRVLAFTRPSRSGA